jgi:hypothetical protein
VVTEDDLTRCGILPFVEKTLHPEAEEDLLVFCLKLAAFLAEKHRKIHEISQILRQHFDQLFQSESPAVGATLLEAVAALLRQPQTAEECLTVNQTLVTADLWPQLAGLLASTTSTQHVRQMTLSCLVTLLSFLQRCSLLAQSETCPSINHQVRLVNFEKVLKTILRDYFDLITSSGIRPCYKQLRCLLRLTSSDHFRPVRNILLEYTLATIEEQLSLESLPVQCEDVLHVVLDTWLALKSVNEFADLGSRVLAVGKPTAQITVIEVCCRQLAVMNSFPDNGASELVERACTDVLVGAFRDKTFGLLANSELSRRFFRRTDLAAILSPHRILVNLLSTSVLHDVVHCATELADTGHLSANTRLVDQLNFLGVLCREAAAEPLLKLTEPVMRAAFLGLLSGYAGAPHEVKCAVCDLLAIELGRALRGADGLESRQLGDLSEYLPALGANILTSVQSWQLRDSAIQVFLKRKIPYFI